MLKGEIYNTYFVIKEFNSVNKSPHEVSFYMEVMPSIFETLKRFARENITKTFFEIADEEFKDVIHTS